MSKTGATSARYPIRAVSKLTGIGIDTLRAWERRYKAVTPGRDDRGRLNTDADIARLRLLRGAVQDGHAIGRLAGLTDAELRRLAAGAARGVVQAVPPAEHPSTRRPLLPPYGNTTPPPSTSRSAASPRL